MSNPFEYLNSINLKKEIEFKESEYMPYLINKALSYHKDSVLLANEMNAHIDLPRRMQYDFYYHGLTRKPRFAKWGKPSSDAFVDEVAQYYKVSKKNASVMIDLLSDEQKEELRKYLNKGGVL